MVRYVLQVPVVTSAESNTELLPKPGLLRHARPLVELHTDFGVELALLPWPLHQPLHQPRQTQKEAS